MAEEKGPKMLSPSMRGRQRYLAFQVLSEKEILFQDLKNTIWHSVLNFLGEMETARAVLRIYKDTYQEKSQSGIIRCSHESVEKVRASLALIERIGDVRVVLHVLGVSGSIKATKMKFFEEPKLTEYTSN